MDASPSSAALRVITERHLWQHITSFQSGLSHALLQFETLNYAIVNKRARLWKPAYIRNGDWQYQQGAANGEWLAWAIVSKRFDIAEQILRLREQLPTQTASNPMFVVGDLPRLVAIAGTVEQLQWIRDQGLLDQWNASLLNYLIYHFATLSKRKIRRRREMEAVMRWLLEFHPECTQPYSSDYLGLTFDRLELLCGIVGLEMLSSSRATVDWREATLEDLQRISMSSHRVILSRDASLPVALAHRGDLESLRFLAENDLAQWSHSCIHEAASHGHLEIVQLIRAYSDVGGRRTLEQAARNGHLDVVRFLETRTGSTQLAFDWAVSRGHLALGEYLASYSVFRFGNALVAAVRNQQVEAVEWIIAKSRQAEEGTNAKCILEYAGHYALSEAARGRHLELFQRIHDVSHPHCCKPSHHRLSPLEEAARSGNPQMAYWFLEHCGHASHVINEAVIKATLSFNNDDECYEMITHLLRLRGSTPQQMDLADTLEKAARRGFQRVVELLLAQGEPFTRTAMNEAITSNNLVLVKTLARRFPGQLLLARLEYAMECDADSSIAMFTFLHEHLHDTECLHKAETVVQLSNRNIPSVWTKLVYLHTHCVDSVQPSDGERTMLASLEAAIRSTSWLGFVFLLRYPTNAEAVQTLLTSLSRSERLHLTLALQRGFPSLFQPWLHLPWPGRLSRVQQLLERGETTEADVIHARQHSG